LHFRPLYKGKSNYIFLTALSEGYVIGKAIYFNGYILGYSIYCTSIIGINLLTATASFMVGEGGGND
jgi:hypothetical protein